MKLGFGTEYSDLESEIKRKKVMNGAVRCCQHDVLLDEDGLCFFCKKEGKETKTYEDWFQK